METKINEIFLSVQGEGPYVGYKQIFIRFCGCNLNCEYCDTEFKTGEIYTPTALYNYIISNYNLNEIHSVSLTGGEPLLHTEFLKEFLPLIKPKTKIYLETNATLYNKIQELKGFIDIISADIKLKSATGQETFELHNKFLSITNNLDTFAKIVFDSNITEEEIIKCANLGKKLDIELILQPKMIGDKMSVDSEFCNKILDKFTSIYPKTRLIPQVHKFLDIK